MIGVTIHVNGQVIYAGTAVNRGEKSHGQTRYETDTGKMIWHCEEDGAVVLARKLLDTIKEQK